MIRYWVEIFSLTSASVLEFIGRTVTVRVRREAAEVDLQVKVGSRAAR